MKGTERSPAPEFDPARVVELDVRDDLRAGREPLGRIVAAADALAPEGVLHVRTTFEPLPLHRLLTRRGFRCAAAAFGPDDWSTWAWRGELRARQAPPVGPAADAPPDVLDLRLLPPPEPMLAVLERVERDPAPFGVLLPFFPAPLVPLLAERGWQVRLEQQRADGVLVRIERRP